MERLVSGKVLLLMGDRAPLRRLTFAMEQQGYEVISVADPCQGLILVDETTPDVVILDVNVPDGLRTCARIREVVNIPIIVAGPDPSARAWKQAVGEGADAYVSVFADPWETLATVGSILRRYSKTRNQHSP